MPAEGATYGRNRPLSSERGSIIVHPTFLRGHEDGEECEKDEDEDEGQEGDYEVDAEDHEKDDDKRNGGRGGRWR